MSIHDEQKFAETHSGLGQITVGEVRAEAQRVAERAQVEQDLVVMLHRRLQSVLRPSNGQQGQAHAFEMHSLLAEQLHHTANVQHATVTMLNDILARLEL